MLVIRSVFARKRLISSTAVTLLGYLSGVQQ